MIIDMLEHCYGPLVEINHLEFYSQDSIHYRYQESKIFLDYLSFGIDVALLQFEKKKRCTWFLSGLQILFIDFVFNKLNDALDNNKSNINYFFVFSAINYLEKLLNSVKYL